MVLGAAAVSVVEAAGGVVWAVSGVVDGMVEVPEVPLSLAAGGVVCGMVGEVWSCAITGAAKRARAAVIASVDVVFIGFSF
ncbi:hypothetical protein GCM10007904_22110 [Oharaeibacter diazotrophicus]|nr:hypothetical protein GCM10007904_22110 [Oharaeibacter diazotrophicus]